MLTILLLRTGGYLGYTLKRADQYHGEGSIISEILMEEGVCHASGLTADDLEGYPSSMVKVTWLRC